MWRRGAFSWLSVACAAAVLLALGAHPAAAACGTIANCADCPNSQCTLCESSYFLLSPTECVEDCNSVTGETRYFNDGNVCTACHSTCEACSGPQKTDCVVCKDGAGYLRDGECVADCGDDYFPTGSTDDALGLRCESCLSGCSTCTNATVCLRCTAGMYLQPDDTCALDCEAGLGAIDTVDGGKCLECAGQDCLDCTSQAAGGCTSCGNSTLLHEGYCESTCPTGTFPDAAAAVCRTCVSRIPGCANCTADGVVCLDCEPAYHQPSNTTCKLTSSCGHFQYEVVAPTLSTDRMCDTCTLCHTELYASTPCTAMADAACSACSAATDGDCGGGTASNQRTFGTCTHDHDRRCDAATAVDRPPAGIAFLEVAFDLGNVPAAPSHLDSGTLLPVLHARLLAAVAALAPAAHDTTPPYTLLENATLASDEVTLRLRLRVAAALDVVAGTAGTLLASVLSDPTAAALFGNASTLTAPFTNAENTTVGSVSAVALTLPAFPPTAVAVTNLTSRRLVVTFADTRNPAANVAGYTVYVQHATKTTAHAAAAVGPSARSAAVDLGESFPSGTTLAYVAAVFTGYGAENGRGPVAVFDLATPTCKLGCLECTVAACLVCDNSTGFVLNDGASQCSSTVGSSASAASCIDLGGNELCSTNMYLFIVGLVVVGLLAILLIYTCCTHKRVVMKDHEEAVADIYIRDVKFVPRWTQRDAKFRATLTQSRPLSARAVVDLAGKSQNLMEEFRSVSLNEAYTDVVPSQAMCRVHEPTFLPNMHSRVLLSIDHSLPNSECLEFANANFIRGHNLRSNAFIATQNPTPEGVEDLWHMVWDHKVPVVVMASGLVEGKAARCPRYWPTRMGWSRVPAPTNAGDVRGKSRNLYFGPFRVRLVRERSSADMVVTSLKLYRGPEGPHVVQHLWLPQWAPSVDEGTVLAALNYVQKMHELRRSAGPILVHCDTGVSRTGLLIGTSLVTQQYYFSKQFDILGLLCQLRQDRGSMVDTPGAYVLMHQVAAQLVRSNTDGSIDDLLRGMFASEPAAPVVETRIALPTDDAISVTESLVGDEALVHRPSAYLAVGSEAPSDVGTLSRPQQPVAKGFVPEATEGDWSMTESDDDESLVSGPKRMSKAKAKKGKTKAGSSSKAKKATAKVAPATTGAETDTWSLDSSVAIVTPDQQLVVGGGNSSDEDEDMSRMMRAIQARGTELPPM